MKLHENSTDRHLAAAGIDIHDQDLSPRRRDSQQFRFPMTFIVGRFRKVCNEDATTNGIEAE